MSRMHLSQRAAVLTALRDLYRLLEAPERWTQGELARGKTGGRVYPESEVAVCWCIAGGLIRVRESIHAHVVALIALDTLVEGFSLANWNDAPERTHADVLALIQSAIERECLAL